MVKNKTSSARSSRLWKLFLSTLYISSFTFGGGFVIVTFMKKKFVDELHWIDEQEMLDMTALAQSSPGAIAVNAAILVGWQVEGLVGMTVAVLGTIIPPMIILSVISVFYNAFAANHYIALLLKGMQAGVAAVILDVVFDLGGKVLKTRSWVYIALMAALIALCAWISVPLGPVPFTMQTFGIFAALGLLGGRRGTLAFLIYLLLGIVGLPVFSGFSAGAGVLFGATGGYLLGYLAAALLFWGLTAKLGQTLPVMASAMVLGLVLCYAFGTFWFLTVYTGGSGETLLGALTLCVFPYVLPDLGKIFLALVLVSRVKKHLAL